MGSPLVLHLFSFHFNMMFAHKVHILYSVHTSHLHPAFEIFFFCFFFSLLLLCSIIFFLHCDCSFISFFLIHNSCSFLLAKFSFPKTHWRMQRKYALVVKCRGFVFFFFFNDRGQRRRRRSCYRQCVAVEAVSIAYCYYCCF